MQNTTCNIVSRRYVKITVIISSQRNLGVVWTSFVHLPLQKPFGAFYVSCAHMIWRFHYSILLYRNSLVRRLSLFFLKKSTEGPPLCSFMLSIVFWDTQKKIAFFCLSHLTSWGVQTYQKIQRDQVRSSTTVSNVIDLLGPTHQSTSSQKESSHVVTDVRGGKFCQGQRSTRGCVKVWRTVSTRKNTATT